MKKTIYLFLSITIALASLSACSSSSSDNDSGGGGGDNGGGGGITASIVGDWQGHKMSMHINGTQIYDVPYEHECATSKDHVMFKTDGTVKSYEYSETCHLFTEDGVYTLSGDTLTIQMEGEDDDMIETFKVLTLNNTKMVIEILNEFVDEDGTTSSTGVRVEYKRI